MFTGLIQNFGEVVSLANNRLQISCARLEGLSIGGSIAVNGVCLTATEIAENIFSADLSSETLCKTTLSSLKPKTLVNLELPLTAAQPVGGHWVQGHVDGVGEILSIAPSDKSHEIRISFPDQIASLVAAKGSIAIDGVSLTINSVSSRDFSVMIIPHTWEQTIIKNYRVGDRVNLEADMMAKYIERALNIFGERRIS